MPLLILLAVLEPLASKRRLVQLLPLNHGAHGPVEDENPLLQ